MESTAVIRFAADVRTARLEPLLANCENDKHAPAPEAPAPDVQVTCTDADDTVVVDVAAAHDGSDCEADVSAVDSRFRRAFRFMPLVFAFALLVVLCTTVLRAPVVGLGRPGHDSHHGGYRDTDVYEDYDAPAAGAGAGAGVSDAPDPLAALPSRREFYGYGRERTRTRTRAHGKTGERFGADRRGGKHAEREGEQTVRAADDARRRERRLGFRRLQLIDAAVGRVTL